MSEEKKKTRLYEDLFDLLEQEFGQLRRSAIAIRVGDKFDWNGHVFEDEGLFHQAVANTHFDGPGPGVIVIRYYRDLSAPPLPKGHLYVKG